MPTPAPPPRNAPSYEAAMTRINVAYDAVKTTARRSQTYRSDEEPQRVGLDFATAGRR